MEEIKRIYTEMDKRWQNEMNNLRKERAKEEQKKQLNFESFKEELFREIS
jgi:hypothetical protein